jgi:hypothetical protein
VKPLLIEGHWSLGVDIFEDEIINQMKRDIESEQEQRQNVRISLSVPIRYRLRKTEEFYKHGQCFDISHGGVRLALEYPVPVGSLMEIELKLPGIKDPFNLKGTVVWIQRSPIKELLFECGVSFNDIKELPSKKSFVYFIADKLCELTLRHTHDFSVRPALTLEEIQDAYKLVYKEYIKKGYCPENDSELHCHYFCLLPGARTFVLEKNQQVLGTLTAIADSPQGLPMESLFHEELNELRAQGRRLMEVSLLALDQDAIGKGRFSLTSFQKHVLSFNLFRLCVEHAVSLGVTDFVIAVNPKHEELYRYLTFRPFGLVKSYKHACGNPAVPMIWDITGEPTRNMVPGSGCQKFFSTPSPHRHSLSEFFKWSGKELKNFLAEHSFLQKKMTETDHQHLKAHYPDWASPSSTHSNP